MSRLANLLLLALSALPAAAQTLRSTSTLVLVPTLVQPPSPEPLPNLTSANFRLTDNGLPQNLSAEHIPHQPLAIVILLQTGASAPRQFPNYTGLAPMLDNLVGDAPHKVALVTFDSQPEILWDFTADLNDLAQPLQHPAPGDAGAAIHDAINYGIDLLEQQPPNLRRVLLLISQTHDQGSQISAKDVVERLGRSNITIDTLTFSPEKTWLKDQFTQPRHENRPYKMSPDYPPLLHTFDLGTPLGMALNALRLDTAAEVASLSGGQHLPFSDKRSLEQQLLLLANQTSDLYTLTFRPTPIIPGFHQLHVEASQGTQPLKTSARSSYWSTTPPSK